MCCACTGQVREVCSRTPKLFRALGLWLVVHVHRLNTSQPIRAVNGRDNRRVDRDLAQDGRTRGGAHDGSLAQQGDALRGLGSRGLGASRGPGVGGGLGGHRDEHALALLDRGKDGRGRGRVHELPALAAVHDDGFPGRDRVDDTGAECLGRVREDSGSHGGGRAGEAGLLVGRGR